VIAALILVALGIVLVAAGTLIAAAMLVLRSPWGSIHDPTPLDTLVWGGGMAAVGIGLVVWGAVL
jgi:hypothetical protein